MTRKRSLFLQHFRSRALRVALAGAVGAALVLPAAAQRFEERFPGDQRRRPPAPVQQQQPSGGFFPFFGGFSNPRPFFSPDPQPQKQAPAADFSRAPAPAHKPGDVQPTSTIVVLGDSMADWLAYGLEDILADTPEVGVVRKHKTHSGLIKYDTKAEPADWAVAAKEILNAEKPTAIVMMVGSNDRLPLRDAPEKPEKPATNETPAIVAPEKKNAAANASHEFQSEKWTELYSKRIDDAMNAMKARGVPVFWVGLPSQRSPRATADALFLNDLYRGRAEKAGIVYVDIWDGFVNEAGKFTIFGPDFEGQNRRLRAGDGVHFTKAGAQKLAHYVDREIKRAVQNRLLPVALPAQDEPSTPSAAAPAAKPGGPAPRPIAGPVVPLSAPPPSGQELLGGGNSRAPANDPLVARVLVKGEAAPVSAGRADDYSWPPGGSAAVATAPTVPLPADVITNTVAPAAPDAAPSVTIVRRPAPTDTPSSSLTTAPAPGTAPTIVRPQQPRAVIRRAPDDNHPDAIRPFAPTATPTVPTQPTAPRPAIRRAPPPADANDAPRPPAPVGRAAFAPPFGAVR